MFKKLVSDIPFNPSLIEHIPEYRASLRRERKLRFIGLFLLCLAFIVQVFISIYPPKPSVIDSPNDLIKGGFSSQSSVVRDCYNNLDDYHVILNTFSISCNDIALAKPITITAGSYQNQLYSLNRVNYGGANEKLVNINQNQYWLRPLSQGSQLSTVKLQALSGVSSLGATYFLLNRSGNIAFIGQPQLSGSSCNSANCPTEYLTARNGQTNDANATTVKSGDTIIYTLVATNSSQSTIKNYAVGANFSSALSYSKIADLYGGSLQKNNYISWTTSSLAPGQTVTRNISFQVDSPIPNLALSASDSNYYNMKMTTVYGNAVNIKLPWQFNKFTELKINNNLPSQGLIFSLIVSLLLILYVSFFLYRNTLMLKELNNVKEDYLMGDRN